MQTAAFAALKALYDTGVTLELLDLDCPEYVEFSPEAFAYYLRQRVPLFGHTWTLAACLTNPAFFE